ncbi:hypothetical protein, partial [Sinorhizobium fredii]|uniref:hypothetical protein n=1 Tax=Rhizobium fredii TaxID=380 RepID=UPI0011810DBE
SDGTIPLPLPELYTNTDADEARKALAAAFMGTAKNFRIRCTKQTRSVAECSDAGLSWPLQKFDRPLLEPAAAYCQDRFSALEREGIVGFFGLVDLGGAGSSPGAVVQGAFKQARVE